MSKQTTDKIGQDDQICLGLVFPADSNVLISPTSVPSLVMV